MLHKSLYVSHLLKEISKAYTQVSQASQWNVLDELNVVKGIGQMNFTLEIPSPSSQTRLSFVSQFLQVCGPYSREMMQRGRQVVLFRQIDIS